jgi:hypothetical protein
LFQPRRINVARRIVVATFPGIDAAYEAAHAIRNLQDAGIADFQPRAGVMLAKDERGNLALLETRDRPLFGTADDVVGRHGGQVNRQAEPVL